MIPQQFIDDLLRRVDVVEVVGQYVQLKRAGANYSGLCPFHTEKSPSFSVMTRRLASLVVRRSGGLVNLCLPLHTQLVTEKFAYAISNLGQLASSGRHHVGHMDTVVVARDPGKNARAAL